MPMMTVLRLNLGRAVDAWPRLRRRAYGEPEDGTASLEKRCLYGVKVAPEANPQGHSPASRLRHRRRHGRIDRLRAVE